MIHRRIQEADSQLSEVSKRGVKAPTTLTLKSVRLSPTSPIAPAPYMLGADPMCIDQLYLYLILWRAGCVFSFENRCREGSCDGRVAVAVD